MKIANVVKQVLEKIHCRWMVSAVAAVMGFAISSCDSGSPAPKEDKKVDSVENTIKLKNPVKQIKYRTDTLSEKKGRALLFYSNGVIIRNYVDKDNLYKMNLSLFSHEDWHAHIDEIKWRSRYKYTPFEYCKLCMHNEITANIAALLTLRYQYIAAKDKKEFAKQNANGIFGFYFNEILKGKINPESMNKKNLEKEYSFIANGVQKAWMSRFCRWYMPSIYGMLQRYVNNNGLVEDSKKNYNYIRRYMYTIGGVDFSKYLKEDIVPEDTRVFLAEGLSKVKSMNEGGSDIMNHINDNYSLLENVGFEKQSEAFQHLLISSKLKYELRNRTADELQSNPQLIDMYYRQVINKLQNDKTFEEYVVNFPAINKKSNSLIVSNFNNYRKTIADMYTFKEVDLSAAVKDFKIDRVPIKTSVLENFYYADNMHYWSPISEIKSEVLNTYYADDAPAETKREDIHNNRKKRISDWQFIASPDYSQPILTAASKEDNAAILKAIRDFEDMPQVLKECDTEAQKKYYVSQTRTAEKKIASRKLPAARKLVVHRKSSGRNI